MKARLPFVLLIASLAGCAGPALKPSVRPAAPKSEALLILPGLGYGRDDDEAFRAVSKAASADGVDVYVASYLTRGGLASSRVKLARFIRDNRLDRYRRLHVFAFLAGGWTFNPLAASGEIPNLTSITYDRSPYQERAPIIAADRLRLLAWMRFGSTVFDLARTSYPPLRAPQVKVGVLVESKPTPFIRKHEAAARALGPFDFGCETLRQPYDDCAYLPLNHDELYTRFADVWPEVISFMRSGRFTDSADRTPPADQPLRTGRVSTSRVER